VGFARSRPHPRIIVPVAVLDRLISASVHVLNTGSRGASKTLVATISQSAVSLAALFFALLSTMLLLLGFRLAFFHLGQIGV
jgi:hypothetical protein